MVKHNLKFDRIINYVQYFFSNADVHYSSSCAKSGGSKICNNDIIGIGNSGIDHPYKKVEVGKEEFKHIIQNKDVSKQDNLIEELINFLKSKKKYVG